MNMDGEQRAGSIIGHRDRIVVKPVDSILDWTCSMQVSNKADFHQNAQHIATFDPVTVKALLLELQDARHAKEFCEGGHYIPMPPMGLSDHPMKLRLENLKKEVDEKEEELRKKEDSLMKGLKELREQEK